MFVALIFTEQYLMISSYIRFVVVTSLKNSFTTYMIHEEYVKGLNKIDNKI